MDDKNIISRALDISIDDKLIFFLFVQLGVRLLALMRQLIDSNDFHVGITDSVVRE